MHGHSRPAKRADVVALNDDIERNLTNPRTRMQVRHANRRTQPSKRPRRAFVPENAYEFWIAEFEATRRIDPSSLRLSGQRLTWREAGRRKTRQLP